MPGELNIEARVLYCIAGQQNRRPSCSAPLYIIKNRALIFSLDEALHPIIDHYKFVLIQFTLFSNCFAVAYVVA